MRAFPTLTLAFLMLAARQSAPGAAQEIPRFDRAPGSTQLIVNGHPFLILGGEPRADAYW